MGEVQGREKDNAIVVMRALLLFSIVAAHSSITKSEITGKISLLVWKIWQVISIMGVPGYFALSGYLYRGNTERVSVMVKKKTLGICIPWLFCGTIVYILSQFPEYSISDATLFIIGYKSYLYYLMILCVFFILFYYVYSKTMVLIAAVMVNIVSLCLAQQGYGIPGITNFLNIFNWCGYFSIGCLCKKFNLFSQLKKDRRLSVISIMALIIVVVIAVIINVEIYFRGFSFIVGTVSVFGFYSLAVLLCNVSSSILLTAGKVSFSVYLLHLPLVSLLKKTVRYLNVNLYFLIPLVTIAIFCFLYKLSEKNAKNSQIKKIIYILLGLR